MGVVRGSAGACGDENFPDIYARLDDFSILSWIYLKAFGQRLKNPSTTTPTRPSYNSDKNDYGDDDDYDDDYDNFYNSENFFNSENFYTSDNYYNSNSMPSTKTPIRPTSSTNKVVPKQRAKNLSFTDKFGNNYLYSGEVDRNNVPYGYGSGTVVSSNAGSANSRVYNGRWQDGLWHGNGSKQFDGQKYDLFFVNSKQMSIEGVDFSFTGQISSDCTCPNGYGTATFTNSVKRKSYDGYWHNGLPNGKGTLAFHDNSYYRGDSEY